jgi:tellurite resistance protein TerC
MRTALGWTGFYSFLAVSFGGFVYLLFDQGWAGAGTDFGVGLAPKTAMVQYLTGWLLEQSLSLDNVFVIALVFAYFGVPLSQQHRVLFWGIVGVLGMRGIMIAAGALLIARFEWILYVFGALLILTAGKLLFAGHEEVDPNKNPFVRFFRRLYPVTEGFHGSKFFVLENGKRAMTPLFLTLVVVESTDLLFAVDSIPAVFAITQEPFLVFTSNIFAILGLRSMYFALAGLMEKFRHVKHALVFILAFVGVKMLAHHIYKVPDLVSLGLIALALTLGVVASLRSSSR